MATIDQLEHQIQELERKVNESLAKTGQLQRESAKALDTAMNAYKLDEYGYLWAYDAETQTYHKTKMRVLTPEIAAQAIKAIHIAAGAVTGDKFEDNAIIPGKIADDAVATRNIKDSAVTGAKIAKSAVGSDKIADKAVTADKLSDDVIGTLEADFQIIIDDLKNEIDSYDEHGIAVSNNFGDDPHIGISQKTLTDAINRIWNAISDITGEVHQGIDLTLSPNYYIGETGSDVHISARADVTYGIFEHIAFYLNDELLASADNVETLEHDVHIDTDAIVKCVATIMGTEYTEEKAIHHYSSFWLGAGASWNDVMNNGNLRPTDNDMRGSYNITVSETGQHIIVIVGAELSGYIRADMNGFEIPMTVTTVDVDGVSYKVHTSDNVYAAGTYNIDING